MTEKITSCYLHEPDMLYFFTSEHRYYRLDLIEGVINNTYPRPMTNWGGYNHGVMDAVIAKVGETKKCVFMVGDKAYEYDWDTDVMSSAQLLSDRWSGLPSGITAAVGFRGDNYYFFKGSQYWRYHWDGTAYPGYPKDTSSWGVNFTPTMATRFPGDEYVYLFNGASYHRVHYSTDVASQGYPRTLSLQQPIVNLGFTDRYHPVGAYREFANSMSEFNSSGVSIDLTSNVIESLIAAGISPPNQDDWMMQALVLGATVFGTIVAVASAGSAVPVMMALFVGTATTASNAAWLFWPTDSDSTWGHLNGLRNSMLRRQRDALDQLKRSFDNYSGEITTAIDHILDNKTWDATKVSKARGHLVPLEVSAGHIRSQMDGSGEPLATLACISVYMYIHTQILIAMVITSDRYNNRPNPEDDPEPGLINTFLSRTRSKLVEALKGHQNDEVDKYTLWTPSYMDIFLSIGGPPPKPRVDGPGLSDEYETTEDARAALLWCQNNAARNAMNANRNYMLQFNTLLAAFKKNGFAPSVSPISESSVTWPF